MDATIETISKTLGIKKSELIENGMQAYLKNEKRRLNSEIIDIFSKYDVDSLEEFDEKINKRKLGETETFDDFTRLDHLLDRRDKIDSLLREI
ncbi:hypothetical protein AKJ39_03025 [candidate division MSBL1 archaeon SCGC-AAA259J03]|uniref:Uncharacterized protein n=1 Tax=candidate division MSBL1 archaeon SCGC-AAA259J03 TaxID=1698269 RepID=A0A656YVU5_9EURY|nr:hypothetical protein AKJ39_03025 [candidate division MSBL1 archaeon SCGC-AAA259J03]